MNKIIYILLSLIYVVVAVLYGQQYIVGNLYLDIPMILIGFILFIKFGNAMIKIKHSTIN